jgi:hypothetical protein
MPQKRMFLLLLLCGFCLLAEPAHAIRTEIFGKASASKSHTSRDDSSDFTLDISGAGGLAFQLFPQLRLEGRFTIRRHTETKGPGFTDLRSQTHIYSVSLDWDILSEKYAIQPFIILGGGYLESQRSYLLEGAASRTDEDPLRGFAANGGLGIRIRVAKSVAFEIEGFAYARDPHKPNPFIDLYGNAGLRLFL